MSWLLELLVDAIREMCSQFIVDMMELITNMFTELLSCNLSLFEELFSVVGSLYKNVIVPTGIAILLMILVWQLFKSMFGGKAGVNAEEPIELICRSAISLFLLAGSKPLVDYILRIAGTPYQWVVGTKVKVASFSGYVSTLEGVTDTLGISSLSISVLMLIMQFVVAWNYFKMLMVIAERYVLLGVFSYTAPLAFATGGSKATNNILASWSKMFGGQVVLVILNAWCMKMFLSGYGNMMASSYGFTKFFAATLCLVGFCKITFKLDSYMASLGVNLGRPAPGMGAAGAMLAASRIISQAARTASGSGGTGDVGGTRTDMGSSDGMTTNFTGPIPMTPNGGNAMDINDMTSDGDFDKPLHTAFRNWCMQRAEEKLEIPTYTNCTICFVHVYDETLPLARVRDHDNYEEKHVQDIITNFFLRSDSGLYTNTCHVTRMGEEDRTLLYVMDSSKFPAWISDFGKETGIEKNHE